MPLFSSGVFNPKKETVRGLGPFSGHSDRGDSEAEFWGFVFLGF